MKKTIIIEILLLLVTTVLIYFSWFFWRTVNLYFEIGIKYSESREFIRWTVYSVLTTAATLATLSAMILIAVNDLPVFKPLMDKYTAWATPRKEARQQAKAQKEAEKKQARIDKLETDLKKLKDD